MEEGSDVLDLTSARPELELAAAVDPDPPFRAVVVGLEQGSQAAEAGGLDVHHPRRVRKRLDVRHRVDRLVPGDAVAVRREHALGLRGQRRVLVPGFGESANHARVEIRISRLVDDRPGVSALEVDGVDRARLHELGHQLVRPRARRIELEAHRRVPLEAPEQRLHARRLAEPKRDHVRDRPGLTADGVGKRAPCLPEGEVEGGAFERPPAVEAKDLPARGRSGEQVELAQPGGEPV